MKKVWLGGVVVLAYLNNTSLNDLWDALAWQLPPGVEIQEIEGPLVNGVFAITYEFRPLDNDNVHLINSVIGITEKAVEALQ